MCKSVCKYVGKSWKEDKNYHLSLTTELNVDRIRWLVNTIIWRRTINTLFLAFQSLCYVWGKLLWLGRKINNKLSQILQPYLLNCLIWTVYFLAPLKLFKFLFSWWTFSDLCGQFECHKPIFYDNLFVGSLLAKEGYIFRKILNCECFSTNFEDFVLKFY